MLTSFLAVPYCITRTTSVSETRIHRSDPRYTWVRTSNTRFTDLFETFFLQMFENFQMGQRKYHDPLPPAEEIGQVRE